jgi:hypothetical protein
MNLQRRQEIIKENIPDISFEINEGEFIEFISFNPKTNKLIINEDSLIKINEFNGNISFASFLGLNNDFKNKVIKKIIKIDNLEFGNQEFSVNLYTHPIYKENDNLYIFILDYNNYGINSNCDSIFMLYLYLISGLIVFNSKGGLNNITFDKLSPLLNLSSLLLISDDKVENEYAISYHFPKFIWNISDFNLNNLNSEKIITSNQYLEQILSDKVIRLIIIY